MLHDGVMTDQGAAWERLDTVAATPDRTRATPSEVTDQTTSIRLRRSRNPALAALDGGGEIFQRRIRDVLVGSAAILAPAVALNLWVTALTFDRVDPNRSGLPRFLTDESGGGVEDIANLLAIVFVSLTTAIVGHYAAQILLGVRFARPVTLGAALLRTAKKVPAISAAWLLTHWWFVLMALVVTSSDDGDIGGLLFLFSFVAWFSSAATLLVIPTMVGERLGPFAAAVRSWRLFRRRFGTCVIFVLLATFLSSLLLFGIATLVPLLEEFGFLEFGSASGIVQGVMVQMAVLVVVPLVALGTAQVYVEVRVAGEGLDLVVDADEAFRA